MNGTAYNYNAQQYDISANLNITAPATDAARQWEGWGTALKPAHEPVLMFRKPLIGTVAENVMAHGTGALNIDGCRVETADNLNGGAYKSEDGDSYQCIDPNCPDAATMPYHDHPSPGRKGRHDGTENWRYKHGGAGDFQQPSGRWPANIVLVHTPDCKQIGTKTVEAPVINRFTDGMKPFGDGAGHPYESFGGGEEEVPVWECADGCAVRALDEQTGTLTSGKAVISGHRRRSSTGAATGFALSGNADGSLRQNEDAGTLYGDSGGASRFFSQFSYTAEEAPFRYMAKANRSERDAGVTGSSSRQVDESRDPDAPGANNPRNRGGRTASNFHPTVKPIALMRWLARLVTQPDGTVLDPFMGSGSTGCAAMYEGFNFIGIEQSDEYLEIARQRIEHHALRAKGGIANPWDEEAPVAKPSPEAGTPSSLDDLLGFNDE